MQTKRYIPIVLILALVASGCSPNKLREARKAAHRIQVTVDAATDTTATLFHDGRISREQTNQFAQLLLKVNTSNKTLIAKAEAAKADTPEVRQALLAQLRLVEDGVRELKAAGVLSIKSANGNLAFESALAALDTSVALIQSILAGR